MISFLTAFFAGVAVQATATFWVLSVDRGYIFLSTLSSMLYAMSMLGGVNESLKSTALAGSYVMGCGAGSLLVVWWSAGRRRRAMSQGKMVFVPDRRRNIRIP